MILKEFFQQSQALSVAYKGMNQSQVMEYASNSLDADICQNIDYKLLKNIASKKIRSKDNFARTLTIFRQNNEVSVQNLKKVIKFILDSYSSDCVAYKALALDVQEVIRLNFSNTATGQSTESQEVEHIDAQLQAKVDELIQKPSVILNQNRQIMERQAGRNPVHQLSSHDDMDGSSPT